MGENDGVPELPEVQALVDFLHERTDGLAIAGVEPPLCFFWQRICWPARMRCRA